MVRPPRNSLSAPTSNLDELVSMVIESFPWTLTEIA
jgi:hypothetical protein